MKMWNKFIITVAGISLMTAVAPAADYNTTVETQPPAATGSMTPQHFVNQAVWGGDKEVALGRLALERSQNPDVRAFAQRMIADHSRANNRLITIADNEGLSYPATNVFYFGGPTTTTEVGMTEKGSLANGVTPTSPSLENPKGLPAEALTMPWEQQTNADIISYRDLGALSGEQFDKAYADAMVKDHSENIRKFQDASENLSDPRLKQFAEQTLPVLQEHYHMAKNLQAKVSGESATP